MKKFLNKMMLFLFIGLSGFSGFSFLCFEKTKVTIINDFQPPANTTIVFCGDSRTETACNPDLIKNSINISKSGEPIFYTFYKLRRLLEHKQNIHTVVLGFSFHSLNDFQDDKLYEFFPSYYLIMDDKGMDYINNKFNQYNTILKKQIKLCFNKTREQQESLWGRYYKSYGSKVTDETINSRIKGHFYKDNSLQSYSQIQTMYMKKILELMQQKHVTLVLLNTPLYADYLKKVPQKYIDTYYDLVKTWTKEYNCVFLDYKQMPLPKNEFGDGDHINAKGAQKFCPILAEDLSQISEKVASSN